MESVPREDMRKGHMRKKQVDLPDTKGIKTNGHSEEYKGYQNQPAPRSTCPFYSLSLLSLIEGD
jgi:hypothetical protein